MPSRGANTLAVTTEPAGAVSGLAFVTQPVLELYDSTNSNAVDTAVVTATIKSGSGTLVGTTTATAAAGIVTFSNLGILGTGAHVLRFTSSGSTSLTTDSEEFTVDPTVDTAAKVVVTSTTPLTPITGQVLRPAPVVERVDGAQAPALVPADPQQLVTASVISGGGTLVGTTSVTTVGGIATFSDLAIVGTPGTTHVVRYEIVGLTTATQTITLSASAGATKAVVTRAASGGTNGLAFGVQPQITRADVSGVAVTGNPQSVVVATVSSGATLVGTTTATTVAGVATFTNLGISGTPGTTYTITYTITGLTVATQQVTVPAATTVATRLVLSRTATNAMNGHTVYIQPQVTQTDANGVTITGTSTTVTATVSSGATLSGTTTATTSGGVAAFSGLIVNGTAGTTYTLTFSASGLTSVSQQVTVSVASNLGMLRAPSGITSGAAFAVQPQIVRRNAGGTTITENPQTTVTASVSSGASLIGSTTATTVNGVATFGNLGIVGVNGSSYSLTFTAAGMAATSITITVGTAVATTTTATTTPTTPVNATTTSTPATSTNATPNRVRPLGGGVSVVPSPANAPKVLRTPITRRLDRAPARTISRNAPVRFVFSDQPRREQVTIAVRINGKWSRVDRVRAGSDRKITLAAMQFARPGTYPLRLRSSGYDHTQYARIVVR